MRISTRCGGGTVTSPDARARAERLIGFLHSMDAVSVPSAAAEFATREIERFLTAHAAEAVAAERERCVSLTESMALGECVEAARNRAFMIAAAIRRGEA